MQRDEYHFRSLAGSCCMSDHFLDPSEIAAFRDEVFFIGHLD